MVPDSITSGQALVPEQTRLDWFGVLCSFGCAVHCAALPVLIATLPNLTNLRLLSDPLFHQIVAIVCGVLVAKAIVPGYRKHRDGRIVTLAGMGLGLLFTAAFILPDTCCADAVELQGYSEFDQRGPAVKLVSTITERTKQPMECDFAPLNCPCSSSISRPLLSAIELESQLGTSGAETLIRTQPYLSPIGGLFLVVAHILNIRLRCCKRSPCK